MQRRYLKVQQLMLFISLIFLVDTEGHSAYHHKVVIRFYVYNFVCAHSKRLNLNVYECRLPSYEVLAVLNVVVTSNGCNSCNKSSAAIHIL